MFSIIAALEDFPHGEGQPDYRSIYRFLAQCMQNDRREDLETLGALGNRCNAMQICKYEYRNMIFSTEQL